MRGNCIKAIKKNQLCKKCICLTRDFNGKNNPFFGKHHTKESLTKMKLKDMSSTQTDEYRKKRRKTAKYGKDNPMYGTSVYEIWFKKYGKNKADELMLQAKKKWSIASSGEKNPMFGKPSPQGSGYGWKGWYRKWFFRSLKELSYMINVIKKEKHNWQTAETKGLTIHYVDPNGNKRTYHADFLINNKFLVEIKPSKLKSSRIVRAKEKAAKKFCKAKGWEYLIVDPPMLSNEEILNLYNNNGIVFTQKYDKMFRERYLK